MTTNLYCYCIYWSVKNFQTIEEKGLHDLLKNLNYI